MSFRLTIRFLIEIFDYIVILCFFLSAIINPTNNMDFIFKIAPFICFSEFIMTHASAVISSNSKLNINSKILLFSIYLFFIIFFGLILKNYYAFLLLFLVLIGKIFAYNGENDLERKRIEGIKAGISVIIFIIIVLLMVFSQIFLYSKIILLLNSNIITFSPMLDRASNLENLIMLYFVLLWGIVHYSKNILLAVINYFRVCFRKPLLFFSEKNYNNFKKI